MGYTHLQTLRTVPAHSEYFIKVPLVQEAMTGFSLALAAIGIIILVKLARMASRISEASAVRESPETSSSKELQVAD